MEKVTSLKDGTEVTIRPIEAADVEKSLAFFRQMPDEDRNYLRVDVTRRDVVEHRVEQAVSGEVQRLIALAGDRIVADGALEPAAHEWAAHVRELRLIVAHSFQRKGLGMVMARDLYQLAIASKAEYIEVHMMRPQTAAHNIFRRLGFHEEVMLPDHVRDRAGSTQDLIMMRCDIKEMWEELEHFFAASDWQRAR